MPLSLLMEKKLLRLVACDKYRDGIYTGRSASWSCCRELAKEIYTQKYLTKTRISLVCSYLNRHRERVKNLQRTINSTELDISLRLNKWEAFEQSLLKYLPLFRNELMRGNLKIASVRQLMAMMHDEKVGESRVKRCMNHIRRRRDYFLEQLGAVVKSEPGQSGLASIRNQMVLVPGEVLEVGRMPYSERLRNYKSSGNRLGTKFSEEMSHDNGATEKPLTDIPKALKDEAFHSEYMVPDEYPQSQSIALTNDTIPAETNTLYSEEEAVCTEQIIPDDPTQIQPMTLIARNDAIKARIVRLYSELLEMKQQRHRLQDNLDRLLTRETEKQQELQDLQKVLFQ